MSVGIRVVSLLIALELSLSGQSFAQPEDFQGCVAGDKWTVLHQWGRRTRQPIPLSKNSLLVGLDDLQFTGPMPSHPFVLGNFAADGKWGLVNGYVQLLKGNDAALQLAWADQFELEGIAEHAGYGGWFLLLGWDQGRGIAINNCNMKVSGSPWFIAEFRGSRAIEDRTVEYDKFDWRKEQPFRVTVRDDALTLEIGRFKVFDQIPLNGYQPGRVVFGVYETRYGTKPIRFKSLRIRALPDTESAEASP